MDANETNQTAPGSSSRCNKCPGIWHAHLLRSWPRYDLVKPNSPTNHTLGTFSSKHLSIQSWRYMESTANNKLNPLQRSRAMLIYSHGKQKKQQTTLVSNSLMSSFSIFNALLTSTLLVLQFPFSLSTWVTQQLSEEGFPPGVFHKIAWRQSKVCIRWCPFYIWKRYMSTDCNNRKSQRLIPEAITFITRLPPRTVPLVTPG